MIWMLDMWIPGEPKTQGSMRHIGGGRMIHPKGLTAWRDHIGEAAKQYTATWFGAWEPIDQPVRVDLAFYMPRPQKPRWDTPATRWDIDKLTRAVFDALAPKEDRKTPPWAVLQDDSRIVEVRARKRYETDGCGVEIRVGALDGHERG